MVNYIGLTKFFEREVDMTTEKHPIGMSIHEGAKVAMVSKATLYSLANQGKLPGARRVGKRIIIHRETFIRWLAEGMGR